MQMPPAAKKAKVNFIVSKLFISVERFHHKQHMNNAHVKYESRSSKGLKNTAKVKVFRYEGQRSRSLGKKMLVWMERSHHKECTC